MTRKNLSLFALLSGLVLLAACGGGMPEEAAEEPMAEAAPAEPEPEPEPEVASSTPTWWAAARRWKSTPDRAAARTSRSTGW